MTAEELREVEEIANDFVLQNAPVETRMMGVDDAIAGGRDGAFRREIRRGGPRGLHGRFGSRAEGPARPIRWSFAAERMSRAPATSGW
jgi:hypothetical protein